MTEVNPVPYTNAAAYAGEPPDGGPQHTGPDDPNGDGSLLVFYFTGGKDLIQVHNDASTADGAQTSVSIEAMVAPTPGFLDAGNMLAGDANWTDVNFQGADSAGPSLDEGGTLGNHAAPGVVAGAAVTATTTVAAGSNGIMAASLTGTQPLHVVDTSGFPPTGTFHLTMNVGNVEVTYTDKDANTFLNCTAGVVVGTDGVATGDSCDAPTTTAPVTRFFITNHKWPFLRVKCVPSDPALTTTVAATST